MTPYERVQALRRELFEDVADLPAPARRTKAVPGGWSPLELLEHTVREDRMLIGRGGIRKGAPGRTPGLNLVLFWNRNAWPIPITLPSLEPRDEADFAEVAAASDAVHRGLGLIVGAAGEGDIVAIHPLVGRMTADQLCEVIASHYLYHLQRLRLPSPGLSAPAGNLAASDPVAG